MLVQICYTTSANVFVQYQNFFRAGLGICLKQVTKTTTSPNCSHQNPASFPRTCPSKQFQEDYFTVSKTRDNINTSCKLPDASSKVPSSFSICQVGTEKNSNKSPPLVNLVPSNSVVSCQVLGELEELFYSAQLLTGGEAAAVFWSSVPNPVSSKTENAN